MNTKPVRVGVIGANPDRGWAKDAHIPAIAQLPGLVLQAVATRSDVSARQAAGRFDAPLWFSNFEELCRSDQVDLVAVCVKVPEHAPLVRAALTAGKHVYCEWPLARNVDEAAELARMAETAGVHHAIGLQAHPSPAVRRARELVKSGRLGRLLTASISSTTSGYAPTLPSAYAYLNSVENGANVTTILGGHTLDLAQSIIGRAVEIDALARTQFPEVRIHDTGELMARTTPDHLLVLSRHEDGCVLTTEVGGYRPPGTPFSFQLVGELGWLRLSGGHPHGFQAGGLQLESDIPFDRPDAPIAEGGHHGAAGNVAEIYAALLSDINANRFSVPDFAHAERLTRLMATVTRAAATGQRQTVDW